MAFIPNTIHRLVYNGIELTFSKFEKFESETLFSDDGVDRLCNHVTLSIRGIMNSQTNMGGDPNADFLTYLRKTMLEPRRPLQVYLNGELTIDNPEGRDVMNGPKPSNVKCYEFSGACVMIEFTVEYWEQVCQDAGLIIISNRWTQSVDIDADGYSTLTSTGTLIVDSSLVAGTTNADEYREFPFPISTIHEGFYRIDQTYDLSSDGNRMDWTVVDREQYIAPPLYINNAVESDDPKYYQPITRWDGSWREESGQDSGGSIITGTLQVKAWGSSNTNKNLLLLFCTYILGSRLRKGDLIRYFVIEEGLSENTVSLTVSVTTFTTDKLNQATTATKIQLTNRIGTPILFYIPPADGGDSLYTEAGKTSVPIRGSGGLWLCIKNIVATCANKNTNTIVRSTGTNYVPDMIGLELSPTNEPISEDENDVKQEEGTPYIRCQIETQVIEVQGIIQLPKATLDPSTPCFYARPSQAISKKIVRFILERLNQAPELPKAEIEGCTLIKSTITMVDPMILASGVDRIYTIRGEYIFGYDSTAQIGYNTITMPASITDKKGITEANQIGPSNFIMGLLS